MFTHYAIRPERVHANRHAADWLVDLQRGPLTGVVHPGAPAPVLSGDENDGIALGLGSLRWGMPNYWMASKGLDPFDGHVLFTTIDAAPAHPRLGASRCLVPVTSIVMADGAELRDPYRPLLTLAALVGSIEVDGEYARGMCFLTRKVTDASTTYLAALLIPPESHSDWLDGWYDLARARSCATPLLRSRLVPV
jgi:putative SOS response-associated peptidase YedK